MELQYCGGCGMLLRDGDFRSGKARYEDNRPWCSECRPPEAVPIAPAPAAPAAKRPISSSRIPRVSGASSTRLAAVQPAPKPNRVPMIVAGFAGAAVVLGLAVVALSSGRRPLPAPEPPRTDSRKPVVPPPPSVEPGLEAKLLEMEGGVGTASDVSQILAACDELKPKLRGTRLESRLRALEEAVQARRRVLLHAAQVDRALEDLKRIEASDPRGRRLEDVRRLMVATAAIAGDRRAEVEAALAAYEKRMAEGTAAIRGREGPFDLDPEGFLRHWLLLGVFPSPDHAGMERDYLAGEAKAEPRGGEKVVYEGVARTWRAFSLGGNLVNFRALDLGMPLTDNVAVYAFALIDLAEDAEGEIRMGSDDGCVLWLDGLEVGRVHRHRSVKPDEDIYGVRIPKGRHRLLLKVEQRDGDFGFMLRLVGKDAKAMKGVRVWR